MNIKNFIFIFIFLFSSLVFGNINTNQVKKVDNILSNQQDIKNRLELLKNKEIYIQKLEQKYNNKNFSTDLDKKYKSFEDRYLKKNLDNLQNKEEFLEFERNSYEILFKRMEIVEKNI